MNVNDSQASNKNQSFSHNYDILSTDKTLKIHNNNYNGISDISNISNRENNYKLFSTKNEASAFFNIGKIKKTMIAPFIYSNTNNNYVNGNNIENKEDHVQDPNMFSSNGCSRNKYSFHSSNFLLNFKSLKKLNSYMSSSFINKCSRLNGKSMIESKDKYITPIAKYVNSKKQAVIVNLSISEDVNNRKESININNDNLSRSFIDFDIEDAKRKVIEEKLKQQVTEQDSNRNIKYRRKMIKVYRNNSNNNYKSILCLNDNRNQVVCKIDFKFCNGNKSSNSGDSSSIISSSDSSEISNSNRSKNNNSSYDSNNNSKEIQSKMNNCFIYNANIKNNIKSKAVEPEGEKRIIIEKEIKVKEDKDEKIIYKEVIKTNNENYLNKEEYDNIKINTSPNKSSSNDLKRKALKNNIKCACIIF